VARLGAKELVGPVKVGDTGNEAVCEMIFGRQNSMLYAITVKTPFWLKMGFINGTLIV